MRSDSRAPISKAQATKPLGTDATAKPLGTAGDKLNFVIALASDPNSSRAALAVGTFIAECFNVGKGYAWPSIPCIAFFTGRKDRSVIDAIGELERRGYIAVRHHRGHGVANEYQPDFRTTNALTACLRQEWKRLSQSRRRTPSKQEETCRSVHVSSDTDGPKLSTDGAEETCRAVQRNVQVHAKKRPHSCTTFTLATPVGEPLRSNAERNAKVPFGGGRGNGKAGPASPQHRPWPQPDLAQPTAPSSTGEEHRPIDLFLTEVLRKLAYRSFGAENGFKAFSGLWPKPDRQPEKLRGAWVKYVVQPGIDPNQVAFAAFLWQWVAHPLPGQRPREYVPPAGEWLKRRGWKTFLPHPLRQVDLEDCHDTLMGIDSLGLDGVLATLDQLFPLHSPWDDLRAAQPWRDKEPVKALALFEKHLRQWTPAHVIIDAAKALKPPLPFLGQFLKSQRWVTGLPKDLMLDASQEDETEDE